MNTVEHLLSCLAEECCEVGQLASKSMRFGVDDRNVLNPTGPTNRERLVEELNDVLAVIGLLQELSVLPSGWQSVSSQLSKQRKVVKFMNYAVKNGTLNAPGLPILPL
jgi:hypothetical protein